MEVGVNEKHTIEFSFNQLLGRAVLRVDGQEVLRKKRWFSEPLADRYDVEIEGRDVVRLRIEKERKQLLGAKYKVYVDNRLTQLYQGV